MANTVYTPLVVIGNTYFRFASHHRCGRVRGKGRKIETCLMAATNPNHAHASAYRWWVGFYPIASVLASTTSTAELAADGTSSINAYYNVTYPV